MRVKLRYLESEKLKRKRNSNSFTTDEAQTATLIYTEGSFICRRKKKKGRFYQYPMIRIGMCSKEGLEPASRVFGTKIAKAGSKKPICPSELYPPDGKGCWRVSISGTKADRIMERLKPLIPPYYVNKWETVKGRCS